MAKSPMTIVSFSVERAMKEDLDRIALQEHRSKSDIFREMYNYYAFKASLRRLQEEGRVIAARLGLETEDDVFRYLSEN